MKKRGTAYRSSSTCSICTSFSLYSSGKVRILRGKDCCPITEEQHYDIAKKRLPTPLPQDIPHDKFHVKILFVLKVEKWYNNSESRTLKESYRKYGTVDVYPSIPSLVSFTTTEIAHVCPLPSFHYEETSLPYSFFSISPMVNNRTGQLFRFFFAYHSRKPWNTAKSWGPKSPWLL